MPSDSRRTLSVFAVGVVLGGLLVGVTAWLFGRHGAEPPPPPTQELLEPIQQAMDAHVRLTRLREAFARASAARLAVAEFTASEGRFPESNPEAGLPEPAAWQGDGLDSVSVGPGGVVTLVFGGAFSGRVQLRPGPLGDTIHHLTWRCTSPDIPDIARIAPGCEVSDD